MAAVVLHETNRKADVAPTIFRNDTNNVTALQLARRQKQLAEEAARLQEEKLKSQVETTETVKNERDQLRRDKDTLTAEKSTLTSEKATLETEKQTLANDKSTLIREKETLVNEKSTLIRDKETLANEKSNLIREMQTLVNEKSTLMREKEAMEREKAVDKALWESKYNAAASQANSLANTANNLQIACLGQELFALDKRYPSFGKPLSNCLPEYYSGATVQLICPSNRMALDAGVDNGTKVHMWEQHIDNGNQKFLLERQGHTVDGEQVWFIKRKDNGYRLYMPSGDANTAVGVIPSIGGTCDYWMIGRYDASQPVTEWILRNVQYPNLCIERDNSNSANGTGAKIQGVSGHSDERWMIHVLAWP